MIQAGARPLPSPGLWQSVWILLRMRLLLTWSNFRRAKPRQKISQVIFLLIIVAIATGGFVFSQVLIRFLRTLALTTEIDLTRLFNALPGLVLALAFFFNLLTNFGGLLQALYLSRDMDFLVAAPLPMRAVFLSKLILAILPGFGLFCLAALPILFGLGSASAFSPLYYPLVVILLTFVALGAAGLAGVLVMAVVRVIPPRRVAEVLGFVGAVLSILLSQMGNLLGAFDFSGDRLSDAANQINGLSPVWSPFTWAGRGLVDIGSGAWLSGAGLTLLTIFVTGGLFALTLASAEQLYYTGWAGLRASTHKIKTRMKRTTRERAVRQGKLLLAAPLRGIIAKDFLLLRRDLRNLSQLITPLILGFVMVVSSLRSESSDQSLSSLPIQDLPVYTNIAFTLFVGWMLVFNLATTAVAREGKNYWLLNAAPLRPAHLLWAKFIVALLPTLAVGWLFAGITAALRSINIVDLSYILLVTGLSFAGLNGILLAFGVVGSNMDAQDPRKIGLRGGPGCLSMVTCLVYFAIGLALFIGPPVLVELFKLGSLEIGRLTGIILGLIFTLLCAVLPMLSLRRRVAMIGQPKD